MDIYKEYGRSFLGADDDFGNPAVIEAAYERLEGMPVNTREEAEEWLDAWAEVQSAVAEVVSRAYFATARNTRDAEAEAEYRRVSEEVIPLSRQLDEKAKRKFLSLPADWVPAEMAITRKNAEWAVELFREKNLPLVTKEIQLSLKYDKIAGEWATDFDGRRLTAQQLRAYLEKPSRDTREKAYRAIYDMHRADYGRLNDLFDEALAVRKEMATNADVPDYVHYMYKDYARLSYGPDAGARFREAIAEYVVPAVNEIMERRREKLDIEYIRPWDRDVVPGGGEPPKVYEDVKDLKAKAAAVLGEVDARFADAFRLMDEKGYLDLENREGKAPGAYMDEFAEERISLIFGNAAGATRDFDTLVHEGGHAMHGFLSRHLPYPQRAVPMEFAEVASMSMELLVRPFLGLVYPDEYLEPLMLKQLEKPLTFLPFMAMLDGFQDWVYTDGAGADREKRAEYWRGLEDRFRPHINWSGLDEYKEQGWQYNHVYTSPLYYIEYGIAQVGALQVYLRSLDDYDGAVRDYERALSLGNTVGLPELFDAAGVEFVMKKPEILKEVVDKTMEQAGF
ncbi:MAG: M3 family oligoendopeptidase [Candidatus Coatesbacteria bacterium]|nr:MAG: M3 family oligoendopeptidase [Candidatus Coatesbacteria bacterium]